MTPLRAPLSAHLSSARALRHGVIPTHMPLVVCACRGCSACARASRSVASATTTRAGAAGSSIEKASAVVIVSASLSAGEPRAARPTSSSAACNARQSRGSAVWLSVFSVAGAEPLSGSASIFGSSSWTSAIFSGLIADEMSSNESLHFVCQGYL